MTRPAVRSVYSSEGLLHSLHRNVAPQSSYVFHFAGRPVAQLDVSGETERWRWLTADHLGTPIAATGTGGALLWQGGFEPFGADWSGAAGAGVFLRLPGQWEEGVWGNASVGVEVSYNVHRWYEADRGRYTKPDLFRSPYAFSDYLYVASNPLGDTDRLGLIQDIAQDLAQQFAFDNTCALSWAREGQRRALAGRGFRWAHCWTSCMIDKTCGRRAARVTVTEIDARGIVMTRTVDPLDRVTALTYANAALGIGYTYEDPGVPFSKGRLTRITRHGETVDYRYDQLSVTTRDAKPTIAASEAVTRVTAMQ